MTLQCLVSSTAINTSHWNLISGRKRGCSVLLARLEIYARGIPSPSHWCLQTRFSVMCLSCHIVRLLADATKPFGLIWRQHCSSRKSICVINKYTECTRELGLCLETWSWQYFEYQVRQYQFWISSQATCWGSLGWAGDGCGEGPLRSPLQSTFLLGHHWQSRLDGSYLAKG